MCLERPHLSIGRLFREVVSVVDTPPPLRFLSLSMSYCVSQSKREIICSTLGVVSPRAALSSQDVIRWCERAFAILSSYGTTHARGGVKGPYDSPPSSTGSAHAASAASVLAQRRPCSFKKVCRTPAPPLISAVCIAALPTAPGLRGTPLAEASPGRRRIHHRRCRSCALLDAPRISPCSNRGSQ